MQLACEWKPKELKFTVGKEYKEILLESVLLVRLVGIAQFGWSTGIEKETPLINMAKTQRGVTEEIGA